MAIPRETIRETILLVEDEETLRKILAEVLEENGFRVLVGASAEEGLAHLDQDEVSVALVDIILPGISGLELLKQSKEISPDTEVLIMTSHSSVETAIQAIREGAYDYLEKPFEDIEEVPLRVRRAVEKRTLLLRNENLLVEQRERNIELASAVDRLSSLLDAGRAIGQFESMTHLLDSFIGLVARELKVERASLMLLDEIERSLFIAASRGIKEVDVQSVRVPLGAGVAGRVAKMGKPVLVKEASKIWSRTEMRADLSESFISAPIILSMPIKFQNKVLGVINITNREDGQEFAEGDLDYLSCMAGQLAVAIERAKHFEELQKAYESLKSTQEQLVISERVKAIGQIAAGVAHDFNNCLSGIQGRAELLRLKAERGDVESQSIKEDTSLILKLCTQGAATIKRVQTYTKIKNSLPNIATDLNSLIREAVEITRPKWKTECEIQGRSIELELELQDIPSVAGSGCELVQLMTNLIFNAVEAMPEGGCLRFSSFLEGDHVVVDVSDTGHGMDKKTREHIFEPFFSTKETGQGLGTSVIYAIVARHRGEITVSSEKDKGTTFRLKLPTYRSTSKVQGDEPMVTTPDSLELRLLLVEDNDISRRTLEELLRLCGHEVVSAQTGSEGLEKFEAGKFDLVITDLSMPGISGLQVASGVKKQDPDTPVMLLSGWVLPEGPDDFRKEGVDMILAKPCQLDDLKRAISQLYRKKTEVGGQSN